VAADGPDYRRPLVVSVVGTRPEAIKMAPLVRCLAARSGLRQELILTGQHGGLRSFFDLPSSAVRTLDVDLSEQTAGEISESLQHALWRQLLRSRPDLVLVQGDTSSALAGALAARDCGILIGHVEAGLRSGNLDQPWPEEPNRIRIDGLAALLFAPTDLAARRLESERLSGRIHVTGNTGIDALIEARGSSSTGSPASDRKLLLVTCHRRENWHRLEEVAAALKRLVRLLPVEVAFLLHTNPRLRQAAQAALAGEPHIKLLDPVAHREMVSLMDRSWAILTDSGGVQEEGPALGKPVLVLRHVTERAEALDTRNIELVGTDPERIFGAVARLLRDPARYRLMAQPSFPFGDGNAAPRIAALVDDFLADRASLAVG